MPRRGNHGVARPFGPIMRVLLIEDDVLVRGLLSDALADDGVEVDGLSNAEDALILLGAGQVPDVLVSDVNLGAGLSGFDLADIARERHPDVEVILISGSAPEATGFAARRHERFLQKPFAPDDLVAAVRDAADEAERDAADAR
ncbi:MAG: response regulator [Acetobacteraceae bacterium]|nr:response regulator [Acetobacteraceae bacterium]